MGLHSSRFQITCAEPVPFTLDGEYGGAYTSADIGAVSRPVTIVYGA